MHDYAIVYQRSPLWKRNLLPRGEEKDDLYRYEDKAGRFRPDNYTCSKSVEERPNLFYAVKNPNTGLEIWPKRTRVWAYSKEEHQRHIAEDLIYWGKDGTGKVPSYKRYRHALRNADGVVPQTLWTHDFAGHTDESRKELREILHDVPSVSDFATPKPTRLIERVLQIATNPGDLIMDSFSGSGTTGHAVLKMNAATQESTARHFILVEMDEKIAPDITRERVKRVAESYTNAKGVSVPGLGGGFRYVRLGDELFDEHGRINETKVRFADLARHVYFSETGEPLPKEHISAKTPLLGVHHGRAVYLLYNGILKDKSVDGGNVLTTTTLEHLPAHDGPKVVYAAGCRFSKARLERESITFKQTPYAIRTR